MARSRGYGGAVDNIGYRSQSANSARRAAGASGYARRGEGVGMVQMTRIKPLIYPRPDIPDSLLQCDICSRKPAKFRAMKYGLEVEGSVLCDECDWTKRAPKVMSYPQESPTIYQQLTDEAIKEYEAEIAAEQLAAERLATKQREQLAAYAHEAWSGWMKYQFEHGGFSTIEADDDGKTVTFWTMNPEKYERWQRQMNTAYTDLPESEKVSDRDEADNILAIVNQ